MYLFQLLRFCWQARLSFMCYPATIQTDYHRELFILRRAIWRLWDNLSNANKQHIIKSQNKCFIRLHSTMINEKKKRAVKETVIRHSFFFRFLVSLFLLEFHIMIHLSSILTSFTDIFRFQVHSCLLNIYILFFFEWIYTGKFEMESRILSM